MNQNMIKYSYHPLIPPITVLLKLHDNEAPIKQVEEGDEEEYELPEELTRLIEQELRDMLPP